MSDKIIEHIKQAYIQHVATKKTYPCYKSDFVRDFINYDLLLQYLNECPFDKRFKHIQKIVQPNLIDFNEFIGIITNEKRFINKLVLHYSECIYDHVADNYYKLLYENEYARCKIKDTEELIKVIKLIAEYEE